MASAGTPPVTPALSVVIATYNRAERLHACLDALNRQSRPPADFEVVVVDDGSSDGTSAILTDYRSRYALRALRQENTGQPTALNRGVAAAKGRFCLLLDDDIVAGPEFVDEHLQAQEAHPGGLLAIGQLTLTVPPDADWFARAFAAEWARHYNALGAGALLGVADCYSGNMSFPRSTFLQLGGFATDLARAFDIELAFRFAGSGLKLAYLPRAVGCQDERKGFLQLARDDERAGASVWTVYLREPAMLQCLELDSFERGGLVWVLLRRTLLALRVPVAVLGPLGSLLGKIGRARRWAGFVRRYAFWRGVQTAIGDRDKWRRLTTGVTILM